MRLPPFWSHVLSPALHALAPAEPVVVARRARNACVLTALLASLLPRFAALGTDTPAHANAIVLAFAVAAVVAHLVRQSAHADRAAWAALAAAGAVPWVVSDGAARWGMWLAAAGLSQLVLGAWRRSALELVWPEPEPDPSPPRTVPFVSAIGRFAGGLTTVFVFWTFVTQHTKVPTGSMQPTILGDHMAGARTYGGDHLLADHVVYALREPQRFEIVVFEYPLRRDILFVKRLIGLPGEHVEIKEGDIWVDGAIVRKPPLVQESLWQSLFPERDVAPGAKPKDIAEVWTANEDQGWRKAGPAALTVKPRGGRETFLRYRPRTDVPDMRVGVTTSAAAADARALVRITTRGTDVTLDVPGGEGATLRVAGEEPVAVDARLGETTRLELAVADGIARAYVDGREVARAEVPVVGAGRSGVAVGAAGGGLRLDDLRLDEDVYYSTAPGGTNVFDVPEDGYVMLGDNSRNSEDSRLWRGRSVRVKGHAEPFVFEETSPDMTGRHVQNLVHANGRVRFVDSAGFARDVAEADIVEEGPLRPMPYVGRADIVGRAALIFWPVPPFGSSFRPRFLP